MLTQGRKGFGTAMHHDGGANTLEYGIHQHGQAGDMIQVGMGQEDVTHRGHLVQTELAQPGPSVNEDVLVNRHGGGGQPHADPAAASKNPYIHTIPVCGYQGRIPRYLFIRGRAGPATLPEPFYVPGRYAIMPFPDLTLPTLLACMLS
jgi:hypothetical protein